MKITKVDIPKNHQQNDGLEHIKMDRLGSVVLIAGKNGSGKTRILNKIFNTFNSKPPKTSVDQIPSRIQNLEKSIEANRRMIKEFELVSTSNNSALPTHTTLESQIDSLKNLIKRDEASLKVENELFKNTLLLETDVQSDSYSFVKFVPKSLNLLDCNQLSRQQILSRASTIDQVGVDRLPERVFAKIQVIQDKWFNATHQHSQVTELEKTKAIADYEKLQEIIEIFLGTEITRTIDDQATLFGFPLGQSNLSDGQKILVQFCLAIYSQEKDLKDLILVMDEPENHLHPSIIIETIERIQKCVTNGQIWIATHSIPLLAHFDPSQIWFVENNEIKHAGKIPEKVLHSLLGNEDQVGKLQDFISLPSQLATSRYAFQSLFEPNSVMTGSSDSQSFQIRQDLLELSKNGKIRILDYGAGKGRLISNMTDLDNDDQNKLIDIIDYIAYDEYPNDKTYCEESLAKAYGNSNKRYYNNFTTLFSDYDKESFDIVIMCNVLHEIDPKDWLTLFQSNGTISKCLKESGVLLLVEDQQIPVGEKAYQKGFLVLDTPQLKDLFKITEKDNDFGFSDLRGDGRLKAHKIPRRLLNQIDETSRIEAIKSMSDTAKSEILKIRGAEKNYKNGTLHGFWTQQFANAQLNLAELSANK